MKYKGDKRIFQGASKRQNTNGSFTWVYRWIGLPSEIDAVENMVGKGPEKSRTQEGPFDALEVTYGNTDQNGANEVTEKWEDDSESLEKDIMFSSLAKKISADGQKEIRRWRSNPETDLDVGQSDPDFPNDPENMRDLQAEILRGVESIQVKTVVLKRTRTIPAGMISPRKILKTEKFYSTAALIALEQIPGDVANALPDDPGPNETPTNAAWGWMPRTSARQFVGHGKVEELDDWVFAAWSTKLYQKVA